MAEVRIGRVTHYYSRLGVAALNLEAPLRKGERVHIRGHTTDLEQVVDSLEIDHRQVEGAGPGDDVALKVMDRAREGDAVYRVLEEPSAGRFAAA